MISRDEIFMVVSVAFIVFVAPALMWCLLLSDTLDEAQQANQLKQLKTYKILEKVYVDPTSGQSDKLIKFEYDGHLWLRFDKSNGYSAGIAHHPDCPCGKK